MSAMGTLWIKRAFGWSGATALLLVVLFAGAVVWPLDAAEVPRGGDDYLIRNVRVVDVERGTSSNLTDVAIIDGKIAAIGAAVERSGLRIIDGRGGFLAPGYWDMHVHSFQLSPQLHHPLMIASGITSVRDMMDCPEASDPLLACHADKQRWSREAAAGDRVSPRYIAGASHLFDISGLGARAIRRRVGEFAGRGIGAMKVYNRLSPTDYNALADAVRRTPGTMLVGHLPKAVSLSAAIDAGQRSFEHAHLLPRHCSASAAAWRSGALDSVGRIELAERVVREYDAQTCVAAFRALREAEAWLVPTHVTRQDDAHAYDSAFLADLTDRYLDPLSRWALSDDQATTASDYPGQRGKRALDAYFTHGLHLTGEAHAAGVGILVGTDASPVGFRYHDELGHLARAGLSPADVLRAATIDAARFAGLERNSGSVAVGKAADLVLLDADPIVDVAAMNRIRWVMQGGRLYDSRAISGLKAYVRRQAASWLIPPKLLWGFATSSLSSEL